MHRDHMLGWPPALLALDPEPRTPNRTPLRPRLTPKEQDERRAQDQHLTIRAQDLVPGASLAPGSLVAEALAFAEHLRLEGRAAWAAMSPVRYFNSVTINRLYRHRDGVLEYLSPVYKRWVPRNRLLEDLRSTLVQIPHPPEGTPE